MLRPPLPLLLRPTRSCKYFQIRTSHIADIKLLHVLSSSVCRPQASRRVRGEGARNRSADWKRATWQRRPLGRAQCRFKMASVRDRYCGICVKNDRICDVFGSGWAQELPWNHGWTPHPAPAQGPLNLCTYLNLNHIAPTLSPHIGTYIVRTC